MCNCWEKMTFLIYGEKNCHLKLSLFDDTIIIVNRDI